jgi:hypothetical protein
MASPVDKARVVSNIAKAAVAGAGLIGAELLLKNAFKNDPSALKNNKYKTDNYQFPSDLLNDPAGRSFHMAIQFMQYQRRSIFNQPFLQASGGIRLPIPNQLVDTFNVNYKEDKQEGAVGAGIEGALQGRSMGATGFSGLNAGAAAKGAAAGLASSIAGAALGVASLGNLAPAQVLQLGGRAQNPFLTVLFDSPTFKKHQFSWTLAPNNEEESNTIKNIIEMIRYHMLPAMSGATGGTLLTYPSMAIINLNPYDDFLYKFKPCVVESFSTNFAPAGSPSFFRRMPSPTSVTINISLMEIEYWLQEDIVGTDLRALGGF